MSFGKIEKLPIYQKAVKSIMTELDDTLEKHSTMTNLIRHLPKHERSLAKDVVRAFIKTGYLRKHRTDTFCWTKEGMDYAKNILGSEQKE